jgi:DNA gyrase subunit A
VVSSEGQLLRFAQSTVTPKGLPAGGMAGMRLGDGASVVTAGVVEPAVDAVVVTVSDAGALKVSAAADYPQKGRGGGGVRCQTFRKSESVLLTAAIGHPAPLAVGASGSVVEYPLERSRRDGPGNAVEAGVAAFGFLRSV